MFADEMSVEGEVW